MFAPLLLFLLLSQDYTLSEKQHALYLMHTGKTGAAIERYQEICKKEGPDFAILHQMAISLMKQGIKKDPESKLLAIYGAGLAKSSSSLEILQEGLASNDPQIQLASLLFIVQIGDDYSDDLLLSAMSSDFLSTRMEASFHMAIKKHPHAVGHIEALMSRLPPYFIPFFPQLFAILGTKEAMGVLQRLLNDPSPQVRIEAIHSLIQTGRDDFLPLLRKRLSHKSYGEVEACAYALGVLKDSFSIPALKKLSQDPADATRLAALKSLYLLGDPSAQKEIEGMALKKDLFAIFALGSIRDSEGVLASLIHDSNIQVRVNAALGLLQRKDKRCLPVLKEILIPDIRDLSFQPRFSLGKTHMAIKVVSGTGIKEENPFIDPNLSLSMREAFLTEMLGLEEESFLQVATIIFDAKQNDLVPHLIQLLETLKTAKTIDLLKEQTQKMGAPLIRDYCNLSLFRLKIEGPYEETLVKWIMLQKGQELIKLRPLLPAKERPKGSVYALTPEETSRLLIESYAAIAERQDIKSIDLLLDALKNGNEKNRYALAGLLIKATE